MNLSVAQCQKNQKKRNIRSTPSPQVKFPPYIPAGSPPITTLPQIFISEVATGWDKSDNEFIEIYNPNDFQVTLSSQNFQLKLVNSSNIVTEKRIDFDRYVIPPKSYFLFVAGEIKKEETTITPDATYSDQLTDVSGVIVMDCEDNIKDRVSWGKPEKQPPFEATEWSGVILDQGLKTGESLERKKDADGNYIDTDDNFQDFKVSPNPNPTNSQGITLYYDSTFPETTLDENSLPADPTFSTEANFIFTSDEEDSTFECSLDNEDWQACESPKNYSNLSVGSHQFQVRATDPTENIDPTPANYSWQIESPPQINPLDVVINEIMYDPFSGSDSYCEYLELYNDSPIDIDLAGWKLISNNDQVLSADILHEGSSTVIKSGGYAIIGDQTEGNEHLYDFNTCQYNIPSYSENAIRLQIDDAGLGLNNSGMTITLKNSQNETIDEISYQSSWGGGGNSGKSLERIKPSAFSDQEPRNWKEGPAGGTPNTQNSNFNLNFPTSIPSNYQISQNTFWPIKSSPYLIRSATVLEGITLTIEPGVVIKFYDICRV